MNESRHLTDRIVQMEDFEILVGNLGTSFLGSGVWPGDGSDWICEEFDAEGLWLLGDDSGYHRDDMHSWCPDGFEEWSAIGASSYVCGMPIGNLAGGHFIAGYPKVINTGYAAIHQQAQDWIDAHQGDLTDCDVEKYMFYKVGLYGAADHVAQGRELYGPTSVFCSAVCYDHKDFLDGIALNLRIHPTALRGREGNAKLRDVTKAYFDQGGMEVQYNVVSSDDMRAAQKDPAAYRDLVVRIAGYSAYFVELSERMQNDIISRTENVV